MSKLKLHESQKYNVESKSKIGKTYIECSTNEVFKSKIILDIIRDMHKQEHDKFRVVSALRKEYPTDFTHIYDVGFHSLKRKKI